MGHAETKLNTEMVTCEDFHDNDEADPQTLVGVITKELICPLCNFWIEPPISQCVFCGFTCCRKCWMYTYECAICKERRNIVRVYMLEEVYPELYLCCENITRGCKFVGKHDERKRHEKTCFQSPISCPFNNSIEKPCNWTDVKLELSKHIVENHWNRITDYAGKTFLMSDVKKVAGAKREPTRKTIYRTVIRSGARLGLLICEITPNGKLEICVLNLNEETDDRCLGFFISMRSPNVAQQTTCFFRRCGAILSIDYKFALKYYSNKGVIPFQIVIYEEHRNPMVPALLG